MWGANFILAEVALTEMAPISFSVSRFAMGGIAMLSVLYVQCYLDAKATQDSLKFLPDIEKPDWVTIILVAILGATLAPWLGIEGLGLTHGARASLWLALGPAISTGFGHLFSTERMKSRGYLGIILAVTGTLILATDGLRAGQGYWLGDLLLVAALAFTIVELHLIKPLAYKYGSISTVALRTIIGGTLYLIIASPSLAEEPWLSLDAWTWIAILAGGAVGVGIGQWVKVRALRKLGPTQVILYGNMVPVAALLIAWLSVGKDPSLLELISALFIISGTFFIQTLDVHKRPDDDVSAISGAGQE